MPLTQSLNWFAIAMMIASAVGLVSYLLIRYICEKSTDCYLFICAFVAIIAGGIFFIGAPFVFAGVSLVWASATFAERAIEPSQENWFETFFKIAVATICSALVALVFLVCINGSVPHRTMSAQDEVWFFNGYLMGTLLAPFAAPIFLWVYRTAHLRPGIDRHLKEGEKLQ